MTTILQEIGIEHTEHDNNEAKPPDEHSMNSSTSANAPSIIREDEISLPDNSVKEPTGLCGILVKVEDDKEPRQKRPRADFYGRKIDHKKKEQKVSFRDMVEGRRLVDVVELESYKKYNKILKKAPVGCGCTII